jgi:hypothetical protein
MHHVAAQVSSTCRAATSLCLDAGDGRRWWPSGAGHSRPGRDSNRLRNVTGGSGIQYAGESWGAAWGDFDGDGWPDLWTGNHKGVRCPPSTPPSLWRNNRNGTFTNIAPSVPPALAGYDRHGSAWADFDNDGDQDIVTLLDSGSIWPSDDQAFVNEGGVFNDRATQLGLANPYTRGRSPLWLDYDNDGRLDLFTANLRRAGGEDLPSTVLHRRRTAPSKMHGRLLASQSTRHSSSPILLIFQGTGVSTSCYHPIRARTH